MFTRQNKFKMYYKFLDLAYALMQGLKPYFDIQSIILIKILNTGDTESLDMYG